jgi:hypothetical protein
MQSSNKNARDISLNARADDGWANNFENDTMRV